MEPAFQSSPGWKCGAEVVQEIDVTNFGTMKFPYGDWLTQTGLKRPETLAVCVILAWTFVRLCAGYAIGASYDEAYYLALARHVSLSYFDHPPMLMWLLAATMKATGSDSIFVLRCALALLFVGTNWLMYRLTTQLFDASAAAFAVFSLNISILFSLGIGGWLETEGPLSFFLLAAACLLIRVLFDRSEHPTRDWLAIGALFGMALLSKYTAVLVIGGIGLFALTSEKHRRWFAHPGPYLAAGMALVVFSPVILWNWQHDWASFRFQGSRAFASDGIRFGDLVSSILGQAALIGPWVWGPLIYVFARGLRDGTSHQRSWFLCCAAAVPILFFTVISLWVKAAVSHVHWEAPGYLFLFPLLGNHVAEQVRRGASLTRRWLVGSLIVNFVAMLLFASQSATGWMTTLAASALGAPVQDRTLQLLDWTELRPALDRLGYLESKRVFVAGDSRYTASKLDTVLGKYLPIDCLCVEPKHFQFTRGPDGFRGWDALIIGPNLSLAEIQPDYQSRFASIEPLEPVDIHRAGRIAVKLNLYLAKSYQP